MTSPVQMYNVSQAFCPLEQHMVRDIDYAKPTIQGALDYAYDNPVITVVSAIAGIAASVLGGCRDGNTHLGIKAIAAPAAVLTAAALTYGANKAGTALWDAATQSATNGWIKDVLDYAYDNPPLLPTGLPALQILYAAMGGAFALKEAYGRPAAVGTVLLSASFPKVLYYGGKTVFDSCFVKDGYCNGVITTVLDHAEANPILTTLLTSLIFISGVLIAEYLQQPPPPIVLPPVFLPLALEGRFMGG